MKPDTPTTHDLAAAREAFEANEPRDLFYRAATDLVDLALRGRTSLSVAEAVAVLLQTWNLAYYRFRKFDARHFADIEGLLTRHERAIAGYRQRSIESYSAADEAPVAEMFEEFERVLGPVGAAKCLHLLAPSFFPLWDRKITEVYGLALQNSGTNGRRYCRFIAITQAQCRALGGEQAIGRNPLKALDEYNYCRHSKGWM